MAIAPFVYMQLPTLGMNSHLMDYGGGCNRLSFLQRSAHEAFESMTGQTLQGFYGDQGMIRGRDGDTVVRVKQEPFTEPGFGGNYPNDPGLAKYHQAGKMLALDKHREVDFVNREKEFIDMVLFKNPAELIANGGGDNGRATDFSISQQHRGTIDGGNQKGMHGDEEACDLSRRTSSAGSTGMSGSSPGSMSPPSPPSRTSLMPSPAGLPLSHSPLPYVAAAAGVPLSPMSSLLLSPNSPGMPPSPLPPYHSQNPQQANGLYYLHRGHHPMHHSIFNGRGLHQHGGKHMLVHVSKKVFFHCQCVMSFICSFNPVGL